MAAAAHRTLIAIAVMTCAPAMSLAQSVRAPAEWEPHEREWLTWFGQGRRDSVTADMVKALQTHVKLTMNVESDSMKAIAREFLTSSGADPKRIDFVVDPNVDYFVRDYVYFVKDKAGNLRAVDFVYTSYGRFLPGSKPPMAEDEKKFGEWEPRLATQLGLPLTTSEFAFEGGGIDTNGNGTLLVIKQMAIQRNPTRSIAQIEAELKRTLGARKIIWLEQGLIEDRHLPGFAPFYRNYFGGGANMHVDELARFVNDTTVILPYIPLADKDKSPVDSLNYPILEANARILRAARTADGKKIKVVRLPMPEIEALKFKLPVDDSNVGTYGRHGFQKGDTVFRMPAASYVNYFVSNDVVLIPKYWKNGMADSQKRKDEEVRQLFVKLFPGREVVSIYALGINRGGGGIHCATRELPAVPSNTR
jgi:agmatine deiminase